jgi:Tol biopolymer transport system component
MRLDDRARRASDGVRRSMQAPPGQLERFDRFRERKQRNRRIGAGALAFAIAIAGILVAVRAFRPVERPVPIAPRSPVGTILYGRWVADLQRSHWFTVAPDGSAVCDLHVVATCAVWWPDGSKILITHDRAPGSKLPLRPATLNPDGSGLTRLDATHDPNLQLGCGDVSPDGKRLVLEGFSDSHPGLGGIYSVRASDGGGLVRLTHTLVGSNDDTPAFSPDGRQILFFRMANGGSGTGPGALFVMNGDGSNLRRITPWSIARIGESWSPDGAWIAFSGQDHHLYLVHPDGTGLHQIPVPLQGAAAAEPVWSPDGAWIVFTDTGPDQSNVFMVRPDGSGLTQVTHANGFNYQTPNWGPSTG